MVSTLHWMVLVMVVTPMEILVPNEFAWMLQKEGGQRCRGQNWKWLRVVGGWSLHLDAIGKYIWAHICTLPHSCNSADSKYEECDDTRARTIELTEEQYLTCRLEWCNKATWAWFSKYWTTDEYKRKRQRAQESCMSSEDNAQNRGGSRNFTETQQLLVFNLMSCLSHWPLQYFPLHNFLLPFL